MINENIKIDITDTKEIKQFLLSINYFITNFEKAKSEIKNKIYIENEKQSDYLHEIELGELDDFELLDVAKKLKEVRKTRRIYKDKMEIMKEIEPYITKFITKGMLAETKGMIEKIDKLTKSLANQKYNAKIIKDLKCVNCKGE